MYIPKHYNNENIEDIYRFIKQYPFGILVSQVNNRPWATHIPFVRVNEGENELLISHISVVNEQGKHIEENQEVMVIFNEPHAYISPSHFESQQNVPTWNYIAVHVYGSIKLVHDEAGKMEILQNTIAQFESNYQQQFERLKPNYLQAHLDGIVAISITINDLQAQFKLSQHKTEHEQQYIKQHLMQSETTTAIDLAKWMKL